MVMDVVTSQDIRLCYFATNDAEARGGAGEGNFWRCGIELARTCHVPTRPRVAAAKDLLVVSEAKELGRSAHHSNCYDCHFRAAQRGPEVAEHIQDALLTKASVDPRGQPVESFLQSTDQTWFVGLSPSAGDGALGTLRLNTDSHRAKGFLGHIVVELSYKTLGKGAVFTLKRLETTVAQQWIRRQRILYDTKTDARGIRTQVPVHPTDKAPPPTEATLRSTPGCWEAYCGVQKLPLKACTRQGTKIVISPDRLAAFSEAPMVITEAVDTLVASHAPYEELLLNLMKPDAQESVNAGGPAPNGRNTPPYSGARVV